MICSGPTAKLIGVGNGMMVQRAHGPFRRPSRDDCRDLMDLCFVFAANCVFRGRKAVSIAGMDFPRSSASIAFPPASDDKILRSARTTRFKGPYGCTQMRLTGHVIQMNNVVTIMFRGV